MEQLIELMRLEEPHEITGVIYPTGVVLKAVEQFEARIKESPESGGILGECSPPAYDPARGLDTRYRSIDLVRASHIVRHLWVEKKTLICKVKLLGKYAEMAKYLDINFDGLPRATGVIEGENVCTDYTIITIDLISPELI